MMSCMVRACSMHQVEQAPRGHRGREHTGPQITNDVRAGVLAASVAARRLLDLMH